MLCQYVVGRQFARSLALLRVLRTRCYCELSAQSDHLVKKPSCWPHGRRGVVGPGVFADCLSNCESFGTAHSISDACLHAYLLKGQVSDFAYDLSMIPRSSAML